MTYPVIVGRGFDGRINLVFARPDVEIVCIVLTDEHAAYVSETIRAVLVAKGKAEHMFHGEQPRRCQHVITDSDSGAFQCPGMTKKYRERDGAVTAGWYCEAHWDSD